MKYSELPSKELKSEAIALEIACYTEAVAELAQDNNVEPWEINEESQEIQDAILNHEYEIEQNKFSHNYGKLVRI
jgi:hypothetical protein